MVYHEPRLETDTLTLVADEFVYKIEFADADLEAESEESSRYWRRFITKSSYCYGNGTRRPR